MRISDHLAAIRDDLRAVETLDGVEIEVSKGRFDASELGRESFRPPAMRVAFLGAPRGQPRADATRWYDASFAVFIIDDGRDRHVDGLDLMEIVGERIELNRFSQGVEGIGVPNNHRLDALYSGDIDKRGISLNSVSWQQPIRLGAPDAADGRCIPDAILGAGTELNTDTDITQLPEDI